MVASLELSLMQSHAWVIEIIRRIDSVGPAGWSACAPIWRDVETAGSAETAEDMEQRAMLIALKELEAAEPELYSIIHTWRMFGVIGDNQEAAVEWLANRVDQMLG